MRSAAAIAEVDRHLKLIRAEATLFGQITMRNDASAPDMLAQARWRMLRLLRAYQLFKHNEIYDPILRLPDNHRSKQAAALKTSCMLTGERYADYTTQWPVRMLAQDAPCFLSAQTTFIDDLDGRLSAEHSAIARLLAELPNIRPPSRQ